MGERAMRFCDGCVGVAPAAATSKASTSWRSAAVKTHSGGVPEPIALADRFGVVREGCCRMTGLLSGVRGARAGDVWTVGTILIFGALLAGVVGVDFVLGAEVVRFGVWCCGVVVGGAAVGSLFSLAGEAESLNLIGIGNCCCGGAESGGSGLVIDGV